MLQACLGHVLFNKYLDKIVIGFKSLKQLKEIDKIKLVRKKFFFLEFIYKTNYFS